MTKCQKPKSLKQFKSIIGAEKKMNNTEKFLNESVTYSYTDSHDLLIKLDSLKNTISQSLSFSEINGGKFANIIRYIRPLQLDTSLGRIVECPHGGAIFRFVIIQELNEVYYWNAFCHKDDPFSHKIARAIVNGRAKKFKPYKLDLYDREISLADNVLLDLKNKIEVTPTTDIQYDEIKEMSSVYRKLKKIMMKNSRVVDNFSTLYFNIDL